MILFTSSHKFPDMQSEIVINFEFYDFPHLVICVVVVVLLCFVRFQSIFHKFPNSLMVNRRIRATIGREQVLSNQNLLPFVVARVIEHFVTTRIPIHHVYNKELLLPIDIHPY